MTLKDAVIDGIISKFEVESLARSVFGRKLPKSYTKDLSMPYEVTLPEWDDLPEHVRGFVLKAFLESDASIKIGYPSEDVDDRPND
jgi:hypothetical protein